MDASVQMFIVFSPHLGNVLFFGCRSESKDFYFRSEWEKAKQMGHLTLFTAFSRDQVRKHVTVLNRNVFFTCLSVYMFFNHCKFDSSAYLALDCQ